MRLSISGLRMSMHVVCDSHHCNSMQILRRFPGSNRGIKVGERWYCSVDCFVESAQRKLYALSNRSVVEIPASPRLSLGLVMLSKGYLTAEQLRTALEQSRWRNETLDATLAHMAMATEKQITAARSAQWGYPVLAQEHIGRMVQCDIPRSLLQSCSAVPMHYSQAAKRILVGFVFRIEHGFLRAVEQMTGCRVEPCFITPTDLLEQTERLTHVAGYDEVLVDEPGSPEKMGRTLGRAAVEIAAEEVEFTECKNHIWARLKGKRGITDVIFRLEKAPAESVAAPGYFSEAV